MKVFKKEIKWKNINNFVKKNEIKKKIREEILKEKWRNGRKKIDD